MFRDSKVIPDEVPWGIPCLLEHPNEPQFQKLVTKLYFGCILVAKRLPKVTPNHQKSEKKGAKIKNVCIHSHYWKRYCDFCGCSTYPRVFRTRRPQTFTKKCLVSPLWKPKAHWATQERSQRDPYEALGRPKGTPITIPGCRTKFGMDSGRQKDSKSHPKSFQISKNWPQKQKCCHAWSPMEEIS